MNAIGEIYKGLVICGIILMILGFVLMVFVASTPGIMSLIIGGLLFFGNIVQYEVYNGADDNHD